MRSIIGSIPNPYKSLGNWEAMKIEFSGKQGGLYGRLETINYYYTF
ncbi:MAG: hypothetical protein GY754_16200 [bacterium]|nr:hypothetical protein [bacterium]